MEQLLDGLKEELDRQPWSAPAYRADLFCHGREVVLKPRLVDRKSFPTEALHIWEYPHLGTGYVVAVDPSSMISPGDLAAIQVVKYGGVQVAEMLMTDCEPEEQLRIAVWLAEFYNKAVLAVEMNGGVGSFMMERLSRGLYGRLWRNPMTRGWGWMTTKESVAKCRKEFVEHLHVGDPMMMSFRLREELQHSMGDHSREKHDDLTTAYLIAHYCSFNLHYCLME